MKLTRLEVLVVIVVILAGLWLGGVVRDFEHRQELRAAHNVPQLSPEQAASASALNERAMQEDHLPDLLSKP